MEDKRLIRTKWKIGNGKLKIQKEAAATPAAQFLIAIFNFQFSISIFRPHHPRSPSPSAHGGSNVPIGVAGLQRAMRRTARQPPRTPPYFFTDSNP
jgi:hypothetical protein